jgi:hypothetical protein
MPLLVIQPALRRSANTLIQNALHSWHRCCLRCAPALPAAAVLLILLVTAGCATTGPWPPAAAEATRTIRVSLDTWHAMIALPREPGAETAGSLEEWGYAERAWYLEGRQELSGVFRALLWPSAGVVEVFVGDHVWAERTPQPPAEVFTFRLTEAGYERLRRHLRATIASEGPIVVIGGSRFFPARRPYHLFHQCHQYAARALQEAGLPVSPFWAFSRASLALQLRRAARLAGAHARPAPGP